nr:tripartite tricarboxylate transporter substrate binding protein [Rhodoferax sp.]
MSPKKYPAPVELQSRRRATVGLFSALAFPGAGLLTSSDAIAQSYPAKPIRFVVPNPPGGGTDAIARSMATQMSSALQWQIVVDNRPGAGGSIGLDFAAKAVPDGYTIVLGETSNLAINPALYQKLPYDPVTDFEPIILVGSVPLVIVVAANSPYRSLADLVAAAKGGSLTMASAGNGTVGHLAGEMLKKKVGMQLLHVPYKGAAQAMTDLLGGQVGVFFASLPSAIAQINSGRLRALAVTSAKRTALLPTVPAVAELGYGDFDASVWYAILAPAKVPASLVSQLNADITRVLQSAEMRTRFLADGLNMEGGTPQRLGSFIVAERSKWAEVVKFSGAKID